MPDAEKDTELETAEDFFAEDLEPEKDEKTTDKATDKEKTVKNSSKGKEKSTEKKEPSKEDSVKTDAEVTEDDEKGEENVGDKGADEEEKPVVTVKDRLEERLKSIKEPAQVKDKDTKTDDKVDEDKKPADTGDKKTLTKEQIAERLSLVSIDDLPGEVIIGDKTINLKAQASEFPDETNATIVLASVIAEKIVEKRLGGMAYAKPDDVNNVTNDLQGVKNQLAQTNFDSRVALARNEEGELRHPDYYDIVYGGRMKDFHEWVGKQSVKIKTLANSLNPDDGVLLLDYYKEDIAQANLKEFDNKQRDKKKKFDDLHKKEKDTKTIKTRVEDGNQTRDDAKRAFEED